ncbi:MAG: hypothetical protein MPJ08_00175 [Nitrosopumilus sp.]|nr:hypothetical protein [Nitrosopumilus sp.]
MIEFYSDRVHAHALPGGAPWGEAAAASISGANSPGRKRVRIDGRSVTVGDLAFGPVSRVGVTVPLFKRECTMVFEGHFGGGSAHVHITARSNYRDVFAALTSWRDAGSL